MSVENEAGARVEHVSVRLGRYELLQKIAKGGMAEIFLARAGSLTGVEKVVVVKRMLPQFASDDDFIEMFLDEARVAACLNHPNVVQMYDAGNEAGIYYMAMEYLHGEDVRSLLNAVPGAARTLPIEHAVHVAIGACAGLHHAHSAVGMDGKPLQIVHRDVSPQNVFVTFDGAVKVVDFGIAVSRNRKSETRAGTLKGKVAYMSPEHLRGDVMLDRRSDVYAVGVMLYEMTLGTRPHVKVGNGEFALMMAIARGDIRSPTAVDPAFPKPLEKILLKALARSPEQRYQSARDLQEDLEAFARTAQLAITPTALEAFMLETFGARVEAWRSAQAEGKDLVAAAVELEQVRRAEAADSDPGIEQDAPDAEPTLELVAATTDYGVELVRRELGGLQVISLSGRLTEAFHGSALGRELGRSTLLDLALVERVTSFGVREWMSLLEAARASTEHLYLGRCSEAFVNQLSMIRSLAGKAQLVSFYAPYVCEPCGTAFRHLVDLERDAPALAAKRAPEASCPVCGGVGALDDDPSYLAFALPHVGLPISREVRDALGAIEREARASSEQVEKLVVGATTRVHVRHALDRAIRWNRVLDGIEGHVVLDLTDVAKTTAEGAINLLQALRTLEPEVASFEILGMPSSVLALIRAPERLPGRTTVASVVFEGECGSCNLARTAPIAMRTILEARARGEAPNLSCRRCNAAMQFRGYANVVAVLLPADAVPEAVPATPSSRATSPPPSPPSGSTRGLAVATTRQAWLVPAIAVGVVGVVAVLGSMAAARRGGARADPGSSFPSSTIASPAGARASTGPAEVRASGSGSASAAVGIRPDWLERAVEDQADSTLFVGVGVGAAEAEALVRARATAIRGLALVVLGRMSDGEVKRFVRHRMTVDGAPAPSEGAEAIAERWMRQVGSIATPTRVATFVEKLPTGTRVTARYSSTHEAQDQAARFYDGVSIVDGLRLAPLFPLLGSALQTKGELVVIAAPEALAAGVGGVGVGDVLLSADDLSLPSIAAFESVRKAAARGATLRLVFERGGVRVTLKVSP